MMIVGFINHKLYQIVKFKLFYICILKQPQGLCQCLLQVGSRDIM